MPYFTPKEDTILLHISCRSIPKCMALRYALVLLHLAIRRAHQTKQDDGCDAVPLITKGNPCRRLVEAGIEATCCPKAGAGCETAPSSTAMTGTSKHWPVRSRPQNATPIQYGTMSDTVLPYNTQ